MAGSFAAGLVLAAILVAAPIVAPLEKSLVGVVLLAFAVGWLLFAVLSTAFSPSPQRWAAVPAVFLALAGLVNLLGSGSVTVGLRWVWPPVLLAIVVWSIIRARHQLPRRPRRWLLFPVLATFTLASVGGGYETVRETLDRRAYPMPGQLVEVGDHRLHFHCSGSGNPTVVLEPGLGEASSAFGWIEPAVAQTSRVCVYDRAGRGWSESTRGLQDGDQIAADLHTLLERARIPGPYVLAGHSFGGLYVQAFAARYPDQVAGLVLLDSTAPQPGPALPTTTRSDTVIGRVAALLPAVAHLGAGRLLARSSYGSLPAPIRDAARANSSTASSLASSLKEFLAGSRSTRQAASLTSLDGKPLIVVTADLGHSDQRWPAKQDQMATLSTNSLHRHVKASHESLLDNETDSKAVTDALHDVVTAVRTGRALA